MRFATSVGSSWARRITPLALRFAGVEASGVGIMLLPTRHRLEVFSGVTAEMDRSTISFHPDSSGSLHSTTSSSSANRSSKC